MKFLIAAALSLSPLALGGNSHPSAADGCPSKLTLAQIQAWPEFKFQLENPEEAWIPHTLRGRTGAFFIKGTDGAPKTVVVGKIELLPRAEHHWHDGHSIEGQFGIRTSQGLQRIPPPQVETIRLRPIDEMTPEQILRTTGWRRIGFRRGEKVEIPRELIGRRALFVFPTDARNPFGVASLEGVVETIPLWYEATSHDEAQFVGEFVLRLDNGKREKISPQIFDELRIEPPGSEPVIIQ